MKQQHTLDWQIGKVFRFSDEGIMGLLKESRLAEITRLGEIAVEHGAVHTLFAGEVCDMEALLSHSLSQPLDRLQKF